MLRLDRSAVGRHASTPATAGIPRRVSIHTPAGGATSAFHLQRFTFPTFNPHVRGVAIGPDAVGTAPAPPRCLPRGRRARRDRRAARPEKPRRHCAFGYVLSRRG